MNETSLAAVPRLFDNLSDAAIVDLASPPGGLSVRLSTQTAVRYVGSTKLLPGPPYALAQDDDGSYSLSRVAIVRVHPETHIVQAKRMVRHAVFKSLVIGVLCGAAAAVCASWYLIQQQRSKALAVDNASPPCLVTAITANGVNCQLGAQPARVAVGQFFPDGQYQLKEVSVIKRSFSARRITDNQLFVFQLAPHQSTQPEGK